MQKFWKLTLRISEHLHELDFGQASGFAAKAINEMMPEKRHANLKCQGEKPDAYA